MHQQISHALLVQRTYLTWTRATPHQMTMARRSVSHRPRDAPLLEPLRTFGVDETVLLVFLVAQGSKGEDD
jgi:hypothetical protein